MHYFILLMVKSNVSTTNSFIDLFTINRKLNLINLSTSFKELEELYTFSSTSTS